jgi:hypothetical protein
VIFAALGTCAVLMLIALVAVVVDSEKPLPKPRPDERNWGINYTTDFRKWSKK